MSIGIYIVYYCKKDKWQTINYPIIKKPLSLCLSNIEEK